MQIKIGEWLLVSQKSDGSLDLWDGRSEYGTEVMREDAAKVASVLLRYVVTGKIGE